MSCQLTRKYNHIEGQELLREERTYILSSSQLPLIASGTQRHAPAVVQTHYVHNPGENPLSQEPARHREPLIEVTHVVTPTKLRRSGLLQALSRHLSALVAVFTDGMAWLRSVSRAVSRSSFVGIYAQRLKSSVSV